SHWPPSLKQAGMTLDLHAASHWNPGRHPAIAAAISDALAIDDNVDRHRRSTTAAVNHLHLHAGRRRVRVVTKALPIFKLGIFFLRHPRAPLICAGASRG